MESGGVGLSRHRRAAPVHSFRSPRSKLKSKLLHQNCDGVGAASKPMRHPVTGLICSSPDDPNADSDSSPAGKTRSWPFVAHKRARAIATGYCGVWSDCCCGPTQRRHSGCRHGVSARLSMRPSRRTSCVLELFKFAVVICVCLAIGFVLSSELIVTSAEHHAAKTGLSTKTTRQNSLKHMFDRASALVRGKAFPLPKHDPSPVLGVSLLILKTARTGSTFFCLELNSRGAHVSQESLLNWQRAANQAGGDRHIEAYFTRSARADWVHWSLVRPMPKNPFSIQLSCASDSKRSLKATAAKLAACASAARAAGGSIRTACRPPYANDASCQDTNGCFQQDMYQKECFRPGRGAHGDHRHDKAYPKNASDIAVIGTSFNYKSDIEMSLGFRPTKRLNRETDEQRLKRQVPVYRKIISSVESTRPTIVTAQTRTNIVRWRISQAFHRFKLGERPAGVRLIRSSSTPTRARLGLSDPVAFFTTKAGAPNALQNLLFARRIKSEAVAVFYEDIARNVSKAINDMLRLGLAGVMGETRTALSLLESKSDSAPTGSKNTKEQHSNAKVRTYIAGYDRVEKSLRPYPCYHKQLTHVRKDATWTLPLRRVVRDANGKSGHAMDPYEVSHHADCCVLDDDEFVRTVDQYLEQSLACADGSNSLK